MPHAQIKLSAAEVDEMFGKPLREKLRAAGFDIRDERITGTFQWAILNFPVDTGCAVTRDISFTNDGKFLTITQS